VPEMSEQLIAGELGFWQRLDLRIHLFICHPCRRYYGQLKLLLATLPGLAATRAASDEDVAKALKHLDHDHH